MYLSKAMIQKDATVTSTKNFLALPHPDTHCMAGCSCNQPVRAGAGHRDSAAHRGRLVRDATAGCTAACTRRAATSNAHTKLTGTIHCSKNERSIARSIGGHSL